MPYIYNTAADAAKSLYKKYLADLESFNETMAKVNLNVPTGLQRLQELNAEIEERMSAFRANRTGRKKDA